MAQGIKATDLLRAHGPTVLTNPEPCSANFLSAHAYHVFIATRSIQDAYPCPHVMTHKSIALPLVHGRGVINTAISGDLCACPWQLSEVLDLSESI